MAIIERDIRLTPDLTGKSVAEARRIAHAQTGSVLDIKLAEAGDEVPQLSVISQKPAPGMPANGRIEVQLAAKNWIRWLPGLFQDADEENGDLLKRFLFITQHLTISIEERLHFIHEYFDPRTTPEQFLPWLASWLAMPLHESWSPDRRREIIGRTPELYRKRGTARGIELYLQFFAQTQATIRENDWPYPGFVIGQHATIGVDTTIAPLLPVTQCFTVRLSEKKQDVPRERLRTIHAVVEQEKPAHAHYAVLFAAEEEQFEPVEMMRITGKTPAPTQHDQRIGVNSRVGGQSDMPAVEEEPGWGTLQPQMGEEKR